MSNWVKDVDGDFINLDMAHLICLDYRVSDKESEENEGLNYVTIIVSIKEKNYELEEFESSEAAYEYLTSIGVY